ncbi:MAG: M14 family zinc carboxypeptidase, partial [Ignavibacteria bacterium]|nr:M14 family zinc carboxypeptidase [Ignavibacteria bacterium]
MKSTPLVRRSGTPLFALLMLILLPAGNATGNEETYSLVRIMPESNDQIAGLWESGVHLDHFVGNFSTGIEVILNSEEISNLTRSGIPFRIETNDLKAEHARRFPPTQGEMEKSRRLQKADGVDGLGFGSMGGFYTFDEVVEQLDSMTLLYPHLITPRSSLGLSHQGRDIWMVKISDNPGIDESASEKAVYYDALHHAREPASMAATLYYMYWMLENYGSDPVATYLVDTREQFFVPVVNPDGYVYNEQTDPNGGGFWRKNRRPNGGNCFGVDLNRNYSFGYGNNNGSSSDPCSETYRGPNAFSEPETQAIRDLLAEINPVIAFTTHTYAERFLNPYGYIAEAPEYGVYSEFASDFVSGSSYLYGITSEMLGYFSSGTTRDYLHSEGTYAWTPELGSDGFWPPQSSIIPIASENLPRFRYLAWVAGAYADVQNIEPLGQVIAGADFEFTVSVKNRGLAQDADDVIVSVSTTYPHASSVVSDVAYGTIAPRSIASNISTPFRFQFTPSAEFLDEVSFVVQVSQDGVETNRDTVSFLVGKASVLFEDNAENGRVQWNVSGSGQQWDTTSVGSRGGSYSFADSRYGNAANNTSNYLTASQSIDLSASVHPYLEFWAKWSIEEDFDYSRIQISTNSGSSWISLAGHHARIFQG